MYFLNEEGFFLNSSSYCSSSCPYY